MNLNQLFFKFWAGITNCHVKVTLCILINNKIRNKGGNIVSKHVSKP